MSLACAPSPRDCNLAESVNANDLPVLTLEARVHAPSRLPHLAPSILSPARVQTFALLHKARAQLSLSNFPTRTDLVSHCPFDIIRQRRARTHTVHTVAVFVCAQSTSSMFLPLIPRRRQHAFSASHIDARTHPYEASALFFTYSAHKRC